MNDFDVLKLQNPVPTKGNTQLKKVDHQRFNVFAEIKQPTIKVYGILARCVLDQCGSTLSCTNQILNYQYTS